MLESMSTEAYEYDTKRLDHLGIVAGICREINLVQLIDESLSKPAERKVSCGEATVAMILNGLGLTGRALYLMPEYMENKPVDILIREGLEASDFNDDTLGRALDELFSSGITEIFAVLAREAVEVYDLEVAFCHTDTSSFSLSGAYESKVAQKDVEKWGAVKITHGYSKDKRPDLKQVVVSLITSQKGRIPLWLEALDGNSSDKHSFPVTVDSYCQQLAEGEMPWFVMDSAAYTKDNINNWGTKKKWITRVPETSKAAQASIQSIATHEMAELIEGYNVHPIESHYGGIEQRWLLIHSEKAYHKELKQLQRRVAKKTEQLASEVAQLGRTEFACEADAHTAIATLRKKLKWHTIEATYQPIKKYAQPGRPAKGVKPSIVGWQIQAICSPQPQLIEAEKQWLGRFILATNELDTDRLPDKKVLRGYKAQGTTVERGFRFLKDPLFFADSLFLKSPGRIMAMIMIMALCLLIYALAEWHIRQQLEVLDQTIPDQRGKPTQKPTMRRIAQMFEGIDLLIIRHHGRIVDRQILKLTPVRLQIVTLFGSAVKNCYFVGF